jgi:hypothetical protein
MSNYYANYTQYLGAQKCCSIRTQGPQGADGPTGPAGGFGQRGWTGPTGSGPTGPTGPTASLNLTATTNATYNTVVYDSATNTTYYNTTKTFVIDHPIDKDKYLVHACLEGPESGVYYRGKGEILDNNSTTIELPYYVNALASDFTVNITPIFNGKLNILNSSEVIDNKFTVYGENCKFHWIVYGKRLDIEVEPNKSETEIKGQGPYLYI